MLVYHTAVDSVWPSCLVFHFGN